jgi:hypothetical protein
VSPLSLRYRSHSHLYYTSGPSEFSKLLAIRYLGATLELPSFWLQTGSVYEATIKKILAKAAVFLRDIGVDSFHLSVAPEDLDAEGLDLLCAAILQGVQSWMVEHLDLMAEFWYEGLLKLLLLLRQYVPPSLPVDRLNLTFCFRPKSEDLFPKAWTYATSPEMRRCVPTPSRIRVFSALFTPCVPRSCPLRD